MRAELFDYPLPEARIAQRPLPDRDAARLLVAARTGLAHRAVREWPELVPHRALVVLNDTRVLRARLLGTRSPSGGRAELLLLRRLAAPPDAGELWLALGRPAARLRPGTQVIAGEIAARVIERLPDGQLTVELRAPGGVEASLERVGHVPLPPYVRRADDAADVERYQTVFARHSGSVAAPTAGLHLTHAALERLRERGIEIAKITLHVGPGTFRPVTTEDLDQHRMHAEQLSVGADAAAAVERARARSAPVVAVGTTVVRALESAADPERPGRVIPVSGETRLLIQPGHRFRVVDALLTNFHMPRSTLLALVSAFAGLTRTLGAYQTALAHDYRFLSYGDAMWIPEREQ